MDSIIFDVDGTLWDSTEIVAESWDEYLHSKEHMNITVTAERLMGHTNIRKIGCLCVVRARRSTSAESAANP